MNKEQIKNQVKKNMDNQRENIAKVLKGDKNVFKAKEIMGLYTDIYNYIIEGDKANSYQGSEMYELYKNCHNDFLKESLNKTKASQEFDNKLIEEVLNQEQLFYYHTKNIMSYFSYLDRSYVEMNNSNSSILKLKKQANKIFYDIFYSQLQTSIIESFRQKLFQEREQKDKQIQRQLERLFKIVVEMRVFQSQPQQLQIKEYIKDDSKKYYEEIYKLYSEKPILEWIQLLNQLKEDEIDRINQIFSSDQTFQQQLNELFTECIIEKFAQEISQPTSDIISGLLEENQFEQFHQLILFFDNLCSPKMTIFVKKFKSIIVAKGEAIVADRKSQPQITNQPDGKKQLQQQYQKYIEQLTGLQQFYLTLIEKYADNNGILATSLAQVMEQITNSDSNYVMDALLAILNSFILRRLDRDNEVMLTQVMHLFQAIQQKDLYLRNYQNALAKRLLTNLNPNIDVEKKVIEQFRKYCGPEHSKRLEQLVRDYEQQQTTEPICIGGIEIKPKILKAEYWPDIQPQFAINYLQFDQLKVAFLDKFVNQCQKNQQIDVKWQDQISMVELTFETNNQYKVIIGAAAGAVLLDFNFDNEPRSLKTLQSKLNIEGSYFEKQIKLLKASGLIVQNEDQTICFNEKYSNKLRNVPIGLMLDFKMEYQQDDIDQDRKIAIQAAIVRIMKAKKLLTFQLLIQAVKDHLRMFKPKDTDIKSVIEILINQEYLKRSPQNMTELMYVS